MNVQLLSYGQEVSLVDGTTLNVVTMLLPNGSQVQAIVTDAGLRAVAGARAPAPFQPQAPPPRQPEALTFGGDYGGGPVGWPDPQPSAAPVRIPGEPREAPEVQADAAGNPILHDGLDVDDIFEGDDEEDL